MIRTKTITRAVILGLAVAPVLLAAATRVVPLPDLNKPGEQLIIDNGRMYAVEGDSVLIYSLKDFKRLKKFGKGGEGPQEFIINRQIGPVGAMFLDARDGHLLVKSFGKLSWFDAGGEFIKEARFPNSFIISALLFGKNIARINAELVNGKGPHMTLCIVDDTFKTIKELDRMQIENDFQPGKGLMVFKHNPTQVVYKDKLFWAWGEGLEIKVVNRELTEQYTIKHPLERVKITEDDKKKVIHFFKTDPETRGYFHVLQPIRFPKYYPPILRLFVTGDKIHVLTFKKSGFSNGVQKTDTLIFDLKGKYLKTLVLPIKMVTPIESFPYTIHEGVFYQLVEDIDHEEWAVHISGLH